MLRFMCSHSVLQSSASIISEESDIQRLFEEYVIKGGLAGSYEYRTERDRTNYIRDVYDTIINRDLVSKYNLSDTTTLEHLAEFMMDNVSNLTSPNNISDTLTANVIVTNHKTIGNYIKYLCDNQIICLHEDCDTGRVSVSARFRIG